MKGCKRLAAVVLAAVMSLAGLSGCGGDAAEGLELAVSVGGAVTTLDPIYAEDLESQNVLVHLYENLMRVGPDGSGGSTVVNGMAKSVDVEENVDGTVTYTFRLRGAKWSDGESVTAHDFVYAWQRLVNPASHAPYASLLSVVCGYQEARRSGDMSLLRVAARNDTTLEVTLNGTYDWFLTEVCTSPATMPLREDVIQTLKEAGAQAAGEGGTAAPWWVDPTALVTNGPYLVTEYDAESSLTLTRGEQYHGGQNGPASITFRFADSAEEAWELYESREVDAVWPLTEERLSLLAEEKPLIPELGTYSVVYQSNEGVFADPLIRQAFALALDRAALLKAAGGNAVAAEGLIPPGVPENQEGGFRAAGGALLENDPERVAENQEQAKEILSQAGYSSGRELGELEYLYVSEGRNAAVAKALCDQWTRVLGVRMTTRGVTVQELWTALRSGSYTLAGVDLEAPGNDAECFLMQWTSDAQNNVVGYANSAYDTLMAIIANAPDGTARMGCLHDAEALLLEDYAISPLYTRGTAWELRSDLTGGVRDARGWFCFSNVMERSA